MAQNKKSFILYVDLLTTVQKLPDNKAGKLFKTILEYVNDQNPKTEDLDLLVQIAFEPVKNQLKRDLKEWEDTRHQRSEAGKKGMQNRWGKSKNKAGKITKDNTVKNPITKITDTVTVNDTVTVTDTVKNNREAFSPPALEDVVQEMSKKVDDFTAMGQAEKFMDHFASVGWVVGKGKVKMKDWRAAARGWLGRMKDFGHEPQPKRKSHLPEGYVNEWRVPQ